MKRTLMRICKPLYGIKAQELAFYLLAFQVLLYIFSAYGRPLFRDSLEVSRKPTSAEEFYFPGYIKAIQTLFALISVVALTGTYGLLIHAGARLSTVSKLPLKAIETNLSLLLSATWPDTSSTLSCNSTVNTIRLLCVGRSGQSDEIQQRKARGITQCPPPPHSTIKQTRLWLTSGSPLTRSIVQLVAWESVTIWLSLIMVCASLLYNGLLTGFPGPDAYPRLVVVLIYLMAYIVHLVFVWRYIKRFLTLVASGAAWSMLHRARFAVVDHDQFQRHLEQSTEGLHFKEIDKANSNVKSDFYFAHLAHEQPTQQSESHPDPEKIKELRDAIATIDDVAKTERNNATIYSNDALARVEANAIIACSIIVSYGFAVWTSRLESTESSKLGSLALLASLSIGVGTMYTSAVNLSLLGNSFETICRLKEIKINGLAVDQINKRRWTKNAVGFILGAQRTNRPVLEACRVRIRDILTVAKLGDWIGILIFGPAYCLLPSKEDLERQSEEADFEFNFDVREHRITFTTNAAQNAANGSNKTPEKAAGDTDEVIRVCRRLASETA